MDNNRFEFFCRTKTTYGKNALDHLPADLKAMGAGKPLVVANKVAAANGATAHMIDAFKESGMILGIYADAGKNASIDTLRELNDLYNNKGFDAIIALGGGIVAELCKLLNIVVTNGPNALKAGRGKDNIDAPLRPLVYIPCGLCTGMETSRFANLADDTYASEFLMPDIAVIDPRMFSGERWKTQWETIANESLRCLANCLESYASGDNPLIRSYAHTALRLITETISSLVKCAPSEENDFPDPKRKTGKQEGLARLAQASVINGYVISNCDTLICRHLGRIISDKSGTPDGVCMAIILPHLLEYLHKDREMGRMLLPLVGIEQFCRIPEARRFEWTLSHLRDMIDNLHRAGNGRIPRTLAEAGIGQEDLAGIRQRDLKDIAASLPNQTGMEPDALSLILEKALNRVPKASGL